jgi:hypothetical protein
MRLWLSSLSVDLLIIAVAFWFVCKGWRNIR